MARSSTSSRWSASSTPCCSRNIRKPRHPTSSLSSSAPTKTRVGPSTRGDGAAGRWLASASSQSKALLISAGLKPAWPVPRTGGRFWRESRSRTQVGVVGEVVLEQVQQDIQDAFFHFPSACAASGACGGRTTGCTAAVLTTIDRRSSGRVATATRPSSSMTQQHGGQVGGRQSGALDQLIHTGWVMAQRLPQPLVVRRSHRAAGRCVPGACGHRRRARSGWLRDGAASRPRKAAASVCGQRRQRRRAPRSASSTSAAPSRISRWQPRAIGLWIEPGTANTSRPASAARRAVISAPERSRPRPPACPASPARMRLRLGKCSRARAGAGRVFADHRAARRRCRASSAALPRRVGDVRAGAEHGDGAAAGGQRGLVRRARRCPRPGRWPRASPAAASARANGARVVASARRGARGCRRSATDGCHSRPASPATNSASGGLATRRSSGG